MAAVVIAFAVVAAVAVIAVMAGRNPLTMGKSESQSASSAAVTKVVEE